MSNDNILTPQSYCVYPIDISALQSLQKIKQVKVGDLGQYIDKDQRLTIHGGTDPYTFKYEPYVEGV